GEYWIRNLVPEEGRLAFARPPGTFGDVMVAVDARMVGDGGGRYALSCREDQQPDSGYRGYIDPRTGTASIGKRIRGQTVTRMLTSSEAIALGLAAHHVEFLCIGDMLSLKVNGADLLSVRDTAFTEVRISLSL